MRLRANMRLQVQASVSVHMRNIKYTSHRGGLEEAIVIFRVPRISPNFKLRSTKLIGFEL